MPASRPRRDGTDHKAVGLFLACLLAALAGAVDASGLSILGDLYVSFMSGNTTSFGAALAQGELARAALIAAIIGTFVGGAAAGTVIGTVAGRTRLPVILVAVAPVLAVPLVAPHWTVPALPFAMGMLNISMQQAGKIPVTIAYVTGTLVKLGRGLGEWMCGQAKDWDWLLQATPWVGLLAGAVCATWSLRHLGHRTFGAPPLAALFLAFATWMALPRQRGSDRSPRPVA